MPWRALQEGRVHVRLPATTVNSHTHPPRSSLNPNRQVRVHSADPHGANKEWLTSVKTVEETLRTRR